MARLLPLLLALAAFLLVAIARQQAARSRSDRTYRPRPSSRHGWGGSGHAADGTQWVVRRAELEGLRDAYSSAALDPGQPLHRCGGCQAYYHQSSLNALKADNHGRCALCGSDDLRAVHVL